MKTRILPLLTFLIVLAHLTGSAIAVEHNSRFTDVSPDSWYAEPVAWAVAQGITTGTSSTIFSPDEICTNAQVITFIWRACGEPEPGIDNPFADVTADKYYYEPALWAYENNIVTGSRFDPNKPCTRSMAVTYLWKEQGSPETVPESKFTDVSVASDYAQAVTWAVEMGITDGTSASMFSPATTCTRAHIITFLYRDLSEIPDEGSNPKTGLEQESTGESVSITEDDPVTDSSSDYIEIVP